MFVKHNVATKTTVTLLAVNSLVGALVFVTLLMDDFPSVVTLTHLSVAGLSGLLAWQIFRKNIRGLWLCIALSLLQVIELETPSWSSSALAPVKLLFSWNFGALNIGVNLFALMLLLFASVGLYKICYSRMS